jgi:very-short-patch-repair endonuclease
MGVAMLGQTDKKILGNHLQRKLRRGMTDTERALWHILQHRQLSGLKFRRQHPFGSYILDFVCLKTKLVIELDGGQHQQQMHYDDERSEVLAKAGFAVLRFWDNEVLQQAEAVKEKIWATLQERQPHPHPDPPLEGEGELRPGPPIEGEGELKPGPPLEVEES